MAKSKPKKSAAKRLPGGLEFTPLKDIPAVASTQSHLASLEPIPSDIKDPIKWADDHIQTLAPQAAKELEWQLKFGSDQARREVARELLAMKGISSKREAGASVPAVINLTMVNNPFAKRIDVIDATPAPALPSGEEPK
jgi:hypothetical protein